jgi:hypothetical protein
MIMHHASCIMHHASCIKQLHNYNLKELLKHHVLIVHPDLRPISLHLCGLQLKYNKLSSCSKKQTSYKSRGEQVSDQIDD